MTDHNPSPIEELRGRHILPKEVKRIDRPTAAYLLEVLRGEEAAIRKAARTHRTAER